MRLHAFLTTGPLSLIFIVVLVLNEMVIVIGSLSDRFAIENEHRHTTEHEHEKPNKSQHYGETTLFELVCVYDHLLNFVNQI